MFCSWQVVIVVRGGPLLTLHSWPHYSRKQNGYAYPERKCSSGKPSTVLENKRNRGPDWGARRPLVVVRSGAET